MNPVSQEEIKLYMNAAQSAMFQYQMIEEALKAYISLAHKVIRSRIPHEVNFDYQDSEFESMPLERLLNVFARLTKNKKLVKELNALRTHRNYIAHKAFALVFLSHVSGTVAFRKEFKKVLAARDVSINAFLALKEELDKMSLVHSRVEGGASGA